MTNKDKIKFVLVILIYLETIIACNQKRETIITTISHILNFFNSHNK